MLSKARIQQWNRTFRSLTAAQKRVAIAKDVIKQIELKTIIPRKGTYVTFSKKKDRYDSTFLALPVQENFDKVQCQTCALGGLLTCMVKFTNDATMHELANPEGYDGFEGMGWNGQYVSEPSTQNLWIRLAKFFGKRQLFLIENIFEGWTYDSSDLEFNRTRGQMNDLDFDASTKDRLLVNKVNETKGLYPTKASDRMVAIMKNIIRNKGEFKPLEG